MENKYSARTIEAPKAKAPPIALRVIKGYRGGNLIMTDDAFGHDTIDGNLEKISKTYSITHNGKVIEANFRLPLTGESLARTVADFYNIKKNIIGSRWLQLGRSLLLPGKRLVVNPPKDEEGDYITDNRIEGYINSAEEVEGVWFGENGFAYVEKFKTGEMSVEEASDNGLVRALEGSRRKAEDFLLIGSKENYSEGVYVWDLGDVRKPVLRVPAMGSGEYDERLDVDGDSIGGCRSGVAFGVLNSIKN